MFRRAIDEKMCSCPSPTLKPYSHVRPQDKTRCLNCKRTFDTRDSAKVLRAFDNFIEKSKYKRAKFFRASFCGPNLKGASVIAENLKELQWLNKMLDEASEEIPLDKRKLVGLLKHFIVFMNRNNLPGVEEMQVALEVIKTM